jgi:hypothetical protein
LRGFGDLFIWFGGFLNKSVQGPIICHPLFPTTTRLLLAPVAIEPVSNFFSLFMWALGTTVLFKCHLPYSLAQSFYIKSLLLHASCTCPY